ncbi:hypothetical protein KCTC52924_00130 [Arenibacter antarcticus]|uniref:DUF2975 domain-containing protein n=1 Tax=Arenibacter antarcticus TaxID=2040469 RepID=A0ABW5VJG0_9FLAO|nr:hypothetical protein [Arenibacter sp. H213]MCM4169104.1 hypothetical protein [Arenibacter sp. H213]
MEKQQSFNMNVPFIEGYDVLFVKLVLTIILFCTLLSILNFLRDKFINKTTEPKKQDFTTLLIVMNKLFFIGGFGFVIANIISVIFSQMRRNSNLPNLRVGGEWDYLIFGIILIFIGIAFKTSRKVLKKESVLEIEVETPKTAIKG